MCTGGRWLSSAKAMHLAMSAKAPACVSWAGRRVVGRAILLGLIRWRDKEGIGDRCARHGSRVFVSEGKV